MLIWAWILFASLSASATETVLSANISRLPLAGNLEILRQADSQATDQPPENGQFQPLSRNLTAGFTRDVHWLRIKLRRPADAPRQWYVEIASSWLNHVDFYAPTDHGYIVHRSGSILPFPEREVAHRNFVFPITLEDESPHTYYVRIQSETAIITHVVLWQPDAFTSASRSEYLLLGLYFGSQAILFLVNLLFLSWLPSAAYRWYCATLLLYGLAVASIQGLIGQYVFPLEPVFASRCFGLFSWGAFAVSLPMVSSFLALRDYYPRIATVFRIAPWLCLLSVLLILAGHNRLMAEIFQPLIQMFSITCIVMSWRIAKLGNQSARWFFFAFVIHVAGLFVAFLGTLALLPWTETYEVVPLLTALIRTVLLNVGIASRFREAEQHRQKAHEMSLQAVTEIKKAQAQREFVSMIAHEIRNPLAIIGTSLHSLRKLHADSTPDVEARYSKIGRAQQRIASLIDNYLTDGRIRQVQEGGFVLQRREVELHLLLADVVQQARSRSDKHFFTVEEDVRSPCMLWADADLLRILFQNLVDNAVKYSPAGGEVRIEVQQKNGIARIAVIDQGRGIAESDFKLIFEMHYRGANDTHGSGVGLHLVKRIAELHFGKVTVQSKVGEGSRFEVTLPCMPQKALSTA